MERRFIKMVKNNYDIIRGDHKNHNDQRSCINSSSLPGST
jgi:hypothetical protein